MTQGDKEQPDDTNGSGKPAASNQELVVAINALGEKYEASHEGDAEHNKEIRTWTRRAGIGVGIYTLLTLALTAVSICQLSTSRDTERRQLRAYICISGVQKVPDPFRTGTVAARLTIKNCGQTPAYNFIINAHLEWSGNKDAPNNVSAAAATVVGPGADEVYIRQLEFRLTSAQIDELESDKNTAFFIADIRFVDTFEAKRFVHIKWVLNAEGDRIGNFSELENSQN